MLIQSGDAFIYHLSQKLVGKQYVEPVGILRLPSEILDITFFKIEGRDIPSIAQTCTLFYAILHNQAQNMRKNSKRIVDHLISILQPEKSVVIDIQNEDVEDEEYLIKKLQSISFEEAATDAVVIDLENFDNQNSNYDYLIKKLRAVSIKDSGIPFQKVREAAFFRIDFLAELFGWDFSIKNSLKEYLVQHGDQSVFSRLEKHLVSPEIIELYKRNDEYSMVNFVGESRARLLEHIEQLVQKEQLALAYRTFSDNVFPYESDRALLVEEDIRRLAREQGQVDIDQGLLRETRIEAGKLVLISLFGVALLLVTVPAILTSRLSYVDKIGGTVILLSIGSLITFGPIIGAGSKKREYMNWQSVAAAISDIVHRIHAAIL